MYASKWRILATKIVINTALPDYSNQTAMRFQTHGAAEEWQGWKTVNQNRQAQSLPAIVYHGKGMPMTW
ncbi:hypothetical protein BGI40_02620 [Snodgrassella communis]|uniref:Uncharacterized protein n=3 Tax=Snodgrassella TaxID=1193515 RepID=A0A2N9WM19_9NEIS|nr:hypothetical protein [Snodgrassella communis]PIT50549.1 hypothetical protein BHC46_00520 [Snodgrassella alvi]KDN14855.1 hypothetical protein SALWKB29_0927 [Snodgrassella communis]PIT08706.1 hypothetical protein BGI29_07790 [Snodgrassella communis]PIT08819.1 hypothetical protein BGI31_05675 [Snodgrassella communis]PIT24721.1 hypothetical protein BGI35_00755 [Snodgrassella communis]